MDYIFAEDGVYFLEVNTIPGMTSASLVPKMVRAAGMDMTTFLSTVINNSWSVCFWQTLSRRGFPLSLSCILKMRRGTLC